MTNQNTTDLRQETEETFTGFLTILSSFGQEDLNQVPFEGSWTAGQVGEHVHLSMRGFTQLLNGPSGEDVSPPDAKIPAIRSLFANDGNKMKSPEFIVPDSRVYDRMALLESIEGAKNDLLTSVDNSKPANTCLAREIPGLGALTGMEAAVFVTAHAQRHARQLERIAEKLGILSI